MSKRLFPAGQVDRIDQRLTMSGVMMPGSNEAAFLITPCVYATFVREDALAYDWLVGRMTKPLNQDTSHGVSTWRSFFDPGIDTVDYL